MTVQIIKADKPNALAGADGGRPTLQRVAAYCRVSTDSEEQDSSYEAQCSHYETYIRDRDDWELVGIYADEGISGTSTKRREEFKRLVSDCEAGKIDLVITKSISRFSRNTLDCLQYIRKLKALGIAVYFEKEAINTLDAKGEVLITIMASIAQQESQSISQNVRMGIQYRMQEGKGRLNTAFFLGFTKDHENDRLAIVPEQAQVVRRIFREYLEGFSPMAIARRLQDDGIPTPAGKTRWYQSTVASMLENEKYCGDLLLQKYYTADFLTHKIVRNEGRFPQYYVRDAHEPIVPRDVYFQVQGELMRRASLKGRPSRIRMGSREGLMGRLVCGECGRTLKRYDKPDGLAPDWRCRSRAYEKRTSQREIAGACPCRIVPDGEAKRAIVAAFNELPRHRDELLRMQERIRANQLERLDGLLDGLKCERAAVEDEMKRREGASDAQDGALDELAAQAVSLNAQRDVLALERAEHANRELRVRFLLELIETMARAWSLTWRDGEASGEPEPRQTPAACADYEQFFRVTRYVPADGVFDAAGRVARYDDDLVVRFVECVVVEDGAYQVRFKAGIHVRVPC